MCSRMVLPSGSSSSATGVQAPPDIEKAVATAQTLMKRCTLKLCHAFSVCWMHKPPRAAWLGSQMGLPSGSSSSASGEQADLRRHKICCPLHKTGCAHTNAVSLSTNHAAAHAPHSSCVDRITHIDGCFSWLWRRLKPLRRHRGGSGVSVFITADGGHLPSCVTPSCSVFRRSAASCSGEVPGISKQ